MIEFRIVKLPFLTRTVGESVAVVSVMFWRRTFPASSSNAGELPTTTTPAPPLIVNRTPAGAVTTVSLYSPGARFSTIGTGFDDDLASGIRPETAVTTDAKVVGVTARLRLGRVDALDETDCRAVMAACSVAPIVLGSTSIAAREVSA